MQLFERIDLRFWTDLYNNECWPDSKILATITRGKGDRCKEKMLFRARATLCPRKVEARPRVSRSSGGCCEAKSPLNRAVIYKEARHEIRRDDCTPISRSCDPTSSLEFMQLSLHHHFAKETKLHAPCNLARKRDLESFSSIFLFCICAR